MPGNRNAPCLWYVLLLVILRIHICVYLSPRFHSLCGPHTHLSFQNALTATLGTVAPPIPQRFQLPPLLLIHHPFSSPVTPNTVPDFPCSYASSPEFSSQLIVPSHAPTQLNTNIYNHSQPSKSPPPPFPYLKLQII